MVIVELKRPDHTNPVKGVQNAVDDWKEGREAVPEGLVMISMAESGEVAVYSYGTMNSALKVLGLMCLGQRTLTNMMLED